MRPKIDLFLTLAAAILCLANVSCAQTARPRIGKDEAIKSVKVASLEGWKEAVSDAGRFRILFHGEPEAADEPVGRGFEMHGDGVNWFALYHDLDAEVADDAALREKYKESIESVVKSSGGKLLARRDVTLNGRPGVECILLRPSAKSYMRAIQIGRRFYTVAVEDYRDLAETDAVPTEVRNFFDSFTFWE